MARLISRSVEATRTLYRGVLSISQWLGSKLYMAATTPLPIDRTGAYLISVFVLVSACLWQNFPLQLAPGIAIGLLGFGAVIVAVRTESLTLWEKLGWTCVAFGLFVLEANGIYKDRADQDDKFESTRRIENSRYETEASTLNNTLSLLTRLVSLTQQIEAARGGDPQLIAFLKSQLAEAQKQIQSANKTLAPEKSNVSPPLAPSNQQLKKSADELAAKILRLQRSYADEGRDLNMGHLSMSRNQAGKSQFNINRENDTYKQEYAAMLARRTKELGPLITEALDLTDIMLTRLPPTTASALRMLRDGNKPAVDRPEDAAMQNLRAISQLLP
jgi:hypothetical protein